MALDNARNDRIAAARDGAIAAAQQAHEAGHLTAEQLSDKVAELDLIARSAGWAPVAPDSRTPLQRAADERLPNFAEDHPAGRSARSPLATRVAPGYAAAGLDAETAEFATELHLQPGVAAQLAATVANERPMRPGQHLAQYSDGARNTAEMAERRAAHEREAVEVLRGIPGKFAAALISKVDRLPRSVLSSIIRTSEMKAEIAKLRSGR